ncbi:MAG TPA: FlgD immunoglobulin-like domain containing protein, partial [Candidatus Limnocylindrales bacterium]|nr:FlgD immunoglobulin-like domain containing protein [Candidatus Limnocylindrales bacterium]
MRNLVAALAVALVAALGAASPAVAAPTSTAKVVIIVGATHGATAGYRSNADQAYAEAIKYTSHVTKVYSPNATWSKVKAAVAGANIVIYFGHGNGWPSPYTYDPTYATKDGMGLNYDLNGDGKLSDYENKYYGEPSMATLGLAPNAIVMLHNLCYASGNSEPGGAAPSLSVARQRIDNYAAGFIKGGARAVIADGHMGPEPYLAALFTSGRSIVDLWRSMPNYHGHVVSYASVRTPGYTDYADPDSTSAGFYRSLVTKPTLTATAVTGAVGDTGVDPTTLAVPGRAVVAVPTAPLMVTASGDTTAGGTLSLPQGTRLKVVARGVPTSPTSPPTILVEGLDDPSIDGYVLASDIAPKDSRAPVLLAVDAGTARFSPNGDGRSDTLAVTGSFSETVAWTVRFRDLAGHVLAAKTGNGAEFNVAWDGLVGGVKVADGTYDWAASGTDAWKNGTATGAGRIVVDTSPPAISGLTPAAATASVFTPNGDGSRDTVATSATSSEAGSMIVRISDGANTTVRSFTAAAVAGSNSVTWDGRNNAGAIVGDGDYTIRLTGRDAAGNIGSGVERKLTVVKLLGFVSTSLSIIYPQDLDRFGKTTNLSFALSRPATVTWTIRNAAGAVVATHLSKAAVGAGTTTWAFDGRREDGAMLARGTFTSYVTASDGTVAISQSRTFEMNAFSIKPSATTARRGSKI